MQKWYVWFMYDAGDRFRHVMGCVMANDKLSAVKTLAALTGHSDDWDGESWDAISGQELAETPATQFAEITKA